VHGEISMKGLFRWRIDADALRSRDAAEICVALRRGVLEIAFEHRRLVGGVRILLSLGVTWHRHHIRWEVPANTEDVGQNQTHPNFDALFVPRVCRIDFLVQLNQTS
jgi:hypothetical protein